MTDRPGCIARLTPRGTNIREKKPTAEMFAANLTLVKPRLNIMASSAYTAGASCPHADPLRDTPAAVGVGLPVGVGAGG